MQEKREVSVAFEACPRELRRETERRARALEFTAAELKSVIKRLDVPD